CLDGLARRVQHPLDPRHSAAVEEGVLDERRRAALVAHLAGRIEVPNLLLGAAGRQTPDDAHPGVVVDVLCERPAARVALEAGLVIPGELCGAMARHV